MVIYENRIKNNARGESGPGTPRMKARERLIDLATVSDGKV